MVSTINATSTGVATTADNSAIIKVQSNGVTVTALAWVNFDGTLTTPITPRSNFNVSSVTKTGTGNYTLNFTNSLADTNYCAVASANYSGGISWVSTPASGGAKTTTTFAIIVANNGAAADLSQVNVVVFGNS